MKNFLLCLFDKKQNAFLFFFFLTRVCDDEFTIRDFHPCV